MPTITDPFLFWTNRDEPFFVASQQTAVNGKVAVVFSSTSGDIGKNMRVSFRMASADQLATWKGYQGTVFTMFEKQVIFSTSNPMTYRHEIFGDEADSGVSLGGDLDYYQGTLNLIIVG